MAATEAVTERFTLAEPQPLLIGGREVRAGQTFPAVEPSTGRIWAQVAAGTAGDVDRAVAAAQSAFETWRESSLDTRQALLWAVAERLTRDAGRWPALLATENGRAVREAGLIDVPTAAEIFRFFSGVVRDLHGRTIPCGPGAHVSTTQRPVGVVAAIVPWNSPLISVAHKLAPALAAGNTIVVKPSELASVSTVEFVRLVQDLFPPGVVNVVTGFGHDAGRALVSHPGVAKVSFTGGTETGRRILGDVSNRLVPALMELGGKGAMVVCPDADLDTVTEDVLTGIFAANGEVCFASSRLMVHRDRYDELLERVSARAEAIVVGDALDPATQLGPLVTARHRDLVAARVQAALSEGAELRAGGRVPEMPGELAGGSYYRPTVLASPDGATSASCEEFFGPVLTVEAWTSEDEVVERVNRVAFGLANGVWSADLAQAYRLADRLDSGMVWVNTWFATPLGQPQGGVKASGFGREGAAATLLEYTATKVVHASLDTTRPPMWT
ncbi:betaine-aldehyde dehydrogenase [Sphaerisporangium krabiense]|uniref:Aldehyde dehydrogenase (NAD+) n=1 Tax=Sphaerisporangium krabiense TaxID=763782 RepID=A0A7W8Z068_9ACTN|nr:aldehyde dehydrogenase family protein [Sphaerisporangium krabiense]MBB5625049.1 aldehyde dehydrogenase (NAD+) [Sphaerisporangium krabiense]GII66912.1 betaine-aldehyde dehydrogenase [Sphaerisporangium krabiense]